MAIMEEALENLKEEGIEEEDLEGFEGEAPYMPEFPFLMITLAVLKDIIDFTDLIGIAGMILNIVVAPILFFYMWGKIGFVRKRLYRKYVFSAILGFIPVLNFFPESSFFVILSYLQEKKQFKKIIEYFETIVLSPGKKAA